MYSCAEVIRWVASDEYQSAGFLRKLGIRAHILMCKPCLRYQRQLKVLTAAFRNYSQEISPSDLEGVKARLMERLAGKS